MLDSRKIFILLSFGLSVCSFYAVDGTMDRYFAMGQSQEQLPVCKAIATQIDGKIMVGGYIEAYGKKTFAVARLLANGKLDESFGKNGIVQTLFTNGETASSAQALMIDTTGRIVAAGFTNGINNVCHACMARYNIDGSLDKSFFGGRAVFKGTVITTFRALEEVSHFSGLVETADQKIVAVGGWGDNNTAQFALARYHSNGALDTSFNAKGIGSAPGTVCTQFDASMNDEACAVTIDSCGKLVVAGSSYASGVKTFALARYLNDGSLDTSFYDGNTETRGTIVTNFLCGETDAAARAVCVQPDGKIVAGGYTNAYCGGCNSTHFALARYTAQGALDHSFGSDSCVPGTLVTNFGNEKVRSGINALLIQTDNKIVAGGFAEFNKIKYFALARYDEDGTCDYSFNGGGAPSGKVLSGSGNNSDEIFGLALANPGDIIAAGRSKNNAMCTGAVARYLCDQDMAAPEIQAPCYDERIVYGARVNIKGSAHNSSKIQIYLDDALLDTIYVKNNNGWNYILPPLSDGLHTLRACEHYEAGRVMMQSSKVKFMVDQHPVAIDQTAECQGMRPMQGSLTARGASGDYLYKIVDQNNCNVNLTDDSGAYTVKATIPSGYASFNFEVEDKITHYISPGTVSLIVREIPVAGSVALDTAQDKPIHGNLELFTMGGEKPYSFEIINDNTNGICVLNPDGSFTFIPKLDFVGSSGFKFLATDVYKISSEPAYVSIQVHPAPKARDYSIDEYVNTEISGQISSLAYDGRKPYKFAVTSVQNHCSVVMEENGSFVCIPEQDYCGQASFEYTIIDARGYASKPYVVTIYLYERIECKSKVITGIKNQTIKKDLNHYITKGKKPYRFSLDKETPNGSLFIDENGALEFVPENEFVGDVHCNVKVWQEGAPEKMMELVTVLIAIKDPTDFEETPIDLYNGQVQGYLPQPDQNLNYNFSLMYAPQGLQVTLNKDGEFSFHVDNEYSDSIEFVYKMKDDTGNKIIKRAKVLYHSYPTAQSLQHEINEPQLITGNLKELITGGITPFHYEIVSNTNGQVEFDSDGSYHFMISPDADKKAEFSFIAIDSHSNKTNVAHIEFNIILQPTITTEIEAPQEESLIATAGVIEFNIPQPTIITEIELSQKENSIATAGAIEFNLIPKPTIITEIEVPQKESSIATAEAEEIPGVTQLQDESVSSELITDTIIESVVELPTSTEIVTHDNSLEIASDQATEMKCKKRKTTNKRTLSYLKHK